VSFYPFLPFPSARCSRVGRIHGKKEGEGERRRRGRGRSFLLLRPTLFFDDKKGGREKEENRLIPLHFPLDASKAHGGRKKKSLFPLCTQSRSSQRTLRERKGGREMWFNFLTLIYSSNFCRARRVPRTGNREKRGGKEEGRKKRGLLLFSLLQYVHPDLLYGRSQLGGE